MVIGDTGMKLANRLSPKTLHQLPDGMYADGGNLYLKVRGNSRLWIVRYQYQGKVHELCIGNLKFMSLAQARRKRDEIIYQLKTGVSIKKPKTLSFRECAIEFCNLKQSEWTYKDYPKVWLGQMEKYVFPVIGDMDIDEIKTEHILTILQPIWLTKTVTAKNIQNRIESVWDYAKAKKLIPDVSNRENPARWIGHLEHLLPKPTKVTTKENFPTTDYKLAGLLYRYLISDQSMSALALAFLLLTVVRTHNVLLAKWKEIDLESKVWVIPGSSDYGQATKNGKMHKVPLTDTVIEILMQIHNGNLDAFVFPGVKKEHFSSRALRDKLQTIHTKCLQETGIGFFDPVSKKPIVPHGFRSMFASWAENETGYQQFLIRECLMHDYKDPVGKAYLRGDQFEKRRQLMQDWANYLLSSS